MSADFEDEDAPPELIDVSAMPADQTSVDEEPTTRGTRVVGSSSTDVWSAGMADTSISSGGASSSSKSALCSSVYLRNIYLKTRMSADFEDEDAPPELIDVSAMPADRYALFHHTSNQRDGHSSCWFFIYRCLVCWHGRHIIDVSAMPADQTSVDEEPTTRVPITLVTGMMKECILV
jgi:hypothetical protein